jgi:hypothetical protein
MYGGTMRISAFVKTECATPPKNNRRNTVVGPTTRYVLACDIIGAPAH